MKKLILVAFAASVALMIASKPAAASVQNVKISGAINSGYLYRSKFDLGETISTRDERQSIFFTQTALQVDADLTDNVSATIGIINERDWHETVTTDTEIDLYLAYVTLREFLYSPLTLKIGRQTGSFGNSLIMDFTGANNLAPSASNLGQAADFTWQTSLDAIRATLDYNPLTLDLVYILQSPADGGSATSGGGFFSDKSDGSYIAGINANYQVGDDMNSEVEAYFWKRNNKLNANVNDAKNDTLHIVGLRGSTNPIEGLNIQAEYAHQSGTRIETTASPDEAQIRNAHLIQFMTNYQIPAMEEYNPVVSWVFTKATGDTDSTTDDSYTAWDPFYEAQSGGTIYNTLFDLTNIIVSAVSFEMNPMEDVTTTLSFTQLWLEEELQSSSLTLRQPDGTTEAVAAEDNKSNLGKEIDFDVTYDYTEDVQIGATLGYFVPGAVFANANDHVAKQAIVNVNVAF